MSFGVGAYRHGKKYQCMNLEVKGGGSLFWKGAYQESIVNVYKHHAVKIRFLSCFSDFHIHCRNDLELQFSCYDHTDKQEICNWPSGVSVSINEKKLQIDRVCHYSHLPVASVHCVFLHFTLG